MRRLASFSMVALLAFQLSTPAFAGRAVFRIANRWVLCSVAIEDGVLRADTLRLVGHSDPARTVRSMSDADFLLDVMWTGWRAPGFVNNAENPVQFTARDFRFVRAESSRTDAGQVLDLIFRAERAPFDLRVRYWLEDNDFFVRRSIAVRDTSFGKHFLRFLHPRRGEVGGVQQILKRGGFGQPVAALVANGGAFWGLEYPTATNTLVQKEGGAATLDCWTEVGERIGRWWIESEPVVWGVTPDRRVKLWFFRYLDRIRVAPAEPYLLYNSWYDLRAPEMVRDSSRIMNEENALLAIRTLRRQLVEKRGIRLDAFVLDDGWDVYHSDWQLRPREFPRGLTPLVNELGQMGAHLGIWIGPIGGYSHRDWRIEAMRALGYETVGNQMCVAGKRYHRRLKELVTDFVRKDSVRYFKWDGIQFSCSEPGHGHLPGIYSRRAVMETVIDLCRIVRAVDPRVFLNVTSGTWLSPWWLKYANTIWMQGSDYGYANVPSISRRDRAITYRDYVLYDDMIRQDFWFPITNLMTHGIVKGRLLMLGGETEPLEKFTDNAVLYLARGPMMWELYITPDLLTEGEWDALAGAIRWAKDRWPVLANAMMIGGDPGDREPYGYVHFRGERGIVAVRNPDSERRTIRIPLDPALGLAPEADSLAVIQVYPILRAEPELYRAGDALEVALRGYELAVLEIARPDSFPFPLLSGMYYELDRGKSGEWELRVLAVQPQAERKILNPAVVSAPFVQALERAADRAGTLGPVISGTTLRAKGKRDRRFTVQVSGEVPQTLEQATVAFLLEPSAGNVGKKDPVIQVRQGGNALEPEIERQKGHWAWVKVPVTPGRFGLELVLELAEGERHWEGSVRAWVIGFERRQAVGITWAPANDSPILPPRPWPKGTLKRVARIGEMELRLGQQE